MTYNDFLNAVIDDGITEVLLAYPRPDQHLKRDGAVAGFEACRGLNYEGIGELTISARRDTQAARDSDSPAYWYSRMYELQVAWVLNVLSAAAYNQGLPTLIQPTARGMIKAADVLGVEATT